MARASRNGGAGSRQNNTKYDAHHNVLDKTYGALADLRRELSDSKAAVAERSELLQQFASCSDSQRAWLILEDYFEKLSLARKDFTSQNWWPRLLAADGVERLEETALLFLRSNRPLPTELMAYANFERFAQIEQNEKEQEFLHLLERWILPPSVLHLDTPRASLKVLCEPVPTGDDNPGLFRLKTEFHVQRPRTGEKTKSISEIVDLTSRAAHERELFAVTDWEFIEWLARMYPAPDPEQTEILLQGADLLQWLAQWAPRQRLILASQDSPLLFDGQLAELAPVLESIDDELCFTHKVLTPEGGTHPLREFHFFAGAPSLIMMGRTVYLLRNAPPEALLGSWSDRPALEVKKLSHRLLTSLRQNGEQWEQLCTIHPAEPQFTFELEDEVIRLRLQAKSELDQSLWQWTGHEWTALDPKERKKEKPDILDDARLSAATTWLRRLDWFTPEPGLWVGDATEAFLTKLAETWSDRPVHAHYLGNPAFHRAFLNPHHLRPRLMVQGSGIDWFSVSAQWEAEGMKLTAADLQRLRSATGKFVKLPDSGWMQLDVDAVRDAHETMADLGLDGLSPVPQQAHMKHGDQLDEDAIDQFEQEKGFADFRKRLTEFQGVPDTKFPDQIKAELRPYQKEGFDFLCHLSRTGFGGVLADDMGLGKTLQTLAWLAYLREQKGAKSRPTLVICPASVLHNWRREAEKFTPHLTTLVLESGAARHNLRKQIPQHDIIVTNYALLRRDLTALKKFEFQALVLDEAQFIKNPSAQVTQCVKQLQANHRLALTGTPLENRLLDLWSIVDFVQPSYLGKQEDFSQNYEPKVDDQGWSQKLGRRRLSARLRPLMLRRLKKQVAKDLPDRVEERRDCDLGEAQRKLYLAELRRSREQVLKAVKEQGLAKSKMHVLAALTRLRQICCHPALVGNDSPSGKTETLFELLEPLVAQGQKVLVFSQFVQMLQLLEKECQARETPTYILTGQTKQRQELVNSFQSDPRGSVFLLSLRAAGTGLNLTTASYVVLYDPWWNPAVEAQAIDRSHRIGQTRNVNAYRLITPGTVEEKIWELQQRKAQTIVDVLGEEGFARNLSDTDLDYLFSES